MTVAKLPEGGGENSPRHAALQVPCATQPTRVLLAAGFPPDYIQDTIVPSLVALGIEVTKVVPVDYKGEIRHVDAVLFMFQYTSLAAHDKFKERTKALGIKFILLERQSSGWSRAFRLAGLRFPGHPAQPAPMPIATVPPKAPLLFVGDGKPLIPPLAHPKQEVHEAEPESGPREVALPFGKALAAERKALGLSQGETGALAGASQSAVSHWECGGAVPAPCYAALVDNFPNLAKAQKPTMATRFNRLGATGSAPSEPVTPPAVEVRPATPVEPPKPTTPRPLPLDGLRRAARALGITGPISVIVDDGASKVTAGESTWHGAGPDEAVETARAALDGMLRAKRDEMQAALNALGAA